MSIPQYPTYKDPGVRWLDQVPSHWRSGNLRWLSKLSSGGTPDKNIRAYWEDGTVPWLNSGAVNEALITEPSTFISLSGFESSSAKWIPSGALVMALAGQGKTKGMVAQLGITSTCNQSMAAIVPTGQLQPRFLLWWLTSNYQNIRNMAGGDMRDGLNLDLLGEIPCPIPPPREQAAIALFLDHETTKIDALVEEQRSLIELLREKRQAVISQAVTKGLSLKVSWRDSGVQWMGEVPKHWGLRTIARASTKITNGFVGPTRDILVEAGVPYVQATHIKEGRVLFDGAYFVTEAWSKSHQKSVLREGDVLIVQTGAGTGDVGLVSSLEIGYNCHALIIAARVKVVVTSFTQLFAEYVERWRPC